MERHRPYRVTTPEGIKLLVMDVGDAIPAAFALMGTTARDKVAVRIMGGCSNMSVQDKSEMLEFFAEGFHGFGGVITSGGTRSTTETGEVDPMVTDVPGYIAERNPGSVALGTIPRVDILRLVEDSRLVLDQYNVPNPTMTGLLIVQNGPDGSGDWDLDVPKYFQLMEQWQSHGGFTALGGVVYNGGGVTKKEAAESARRGWPTILVKGSGRGADEIIGKLESGDEETVDLFGKSSIIVNKGEPWALRAALVREGLI